MYVDESGNATLKTSDNPNERFLCLSGVIINLEYEKKIITPHLNNLKNRYFSSKDNKPIIFHRKEISNGKGVFSILEDFSTRSMFDTDLLELLSKLEYCLVSVCIDKKSHKEKYKSFAYNAYEYSMRVLCERYVYFLRRNSVTGDVLAESRGKREDRELKESFLTMYNTGTGYLNSQVIQESISSRELKLKKKMNNITGLQITDLLVSDSRKQILSENKLPHGRITDFSQKLFEIMDKKYDKNGSNIYGKRLL